MRFASLAPFQNTVGSLALALCLGVVAGAFVACGSGEAPLEPTQTASELRNRCGDNRCRGGETCSSCPIDCGVCAPAPDAGSGLVDAGGSASDAGTIDGGAGATDAGVVADAGLGVDAGTSGRVFYTSTTGADTNPGTQSQPFRTIVRGIAALAAGDTLFIRGGTYAESIAYDAAKSGYPAGTSWTQPVTLSAYPGESVTLHPPPGSNWGFIFTGQSTQYVVVKGVNIDAYDTAIDGIKITETSSTGSASHIRIAELEIKNAHSQGILVSGVSDQNQFLRLNVHHSGSTANPALPPLTMTPSHYHGIYISTDANLVEGCDFHDNPGYGIHVYDGGGSANRNVIRNNRTHDNGVWAQYGGGIVIGCGDDNVAYNNVSWNNGGYGIVIAEQGGLTRPGNNNQAYNNTLYHNGKYGLELQATCVNTIARNNIIYLNNWSNIDDGSIGTIADHNLTSDPRFVDAAAADFHVLAGSPAIDTGTPVSGVPTDADGVARPQGAGFDIGAYEHVP